MNTQLLKLLSLALLTVAFVSACESDKPQKPKPVPPRSDVSELPWNRPRSWEAGAGFGGMMPQSH
ncbi:MAG: hypothetical protein JWO89_2307 [Verrucomicrobiaceae bacterium]|nr:hypothetical protein [Verrucomicrobiaceae bacterium]MDB6118714.1 hypothetical protein [Verrucomicrobiaceae bacterium]